MANENKAFSQLLAEAERGELVLPEFQRPWQWKPKDVISLFDSVRQGFPIGAFLVMERNPNVDITPRPFFAGTVSTFLVALFAVQSGWGIDSRGMQSRLNTLTNGAYPEVPEGGAIWVFAVR